MIRTLRKGENKSISCIPTNRDMKKEREGLKTPVTYATELADITRVAIARGSRKDILTINR